MPTIATNNAANTALRYVNKNSLAESNDLAKLSSGSRIQKASDDAAGLAVGTRIKSDVTVLSQAATNAQQGESVLQTADGALSNIGDILQRLKSLATQAVSGSVDDTSRGYINDEYSELLKEINAIAKSTNFDGQTLLNGSFSGIDFLVGTDASSGGASSNRISISLSDASVSGLSLSGTSVTTSSGAISAATAIDAAIGEISGDRATVGAQLSRFQFRASVISTSTENLSAALSSIVDADIAQVDTQYTNDKTLTQASITALSDANQLGQELVNKLLQ